MGRVYNCAGGPTDRDDWFASVHGGVIHFDFVGANAGITDRR
jgi:hypothetical protein